MTFLIKQARSRRAALRGVLGGLGITVGLPLLDCDLNDHGTALAAGGPLPLRFGTWFWGLGHNPGRGFSPVAGPDFEMLEECQPIARHKDYLNVFSNFNTPLDGRKLAVHFTGWVACRTGIVPGDRGIEGSTLDVPIADAIGTRTRFRSLEVSATGDPKDSYSYRNSGSQNLAEVAPDALYTRLFGPQFVDPNSADFKPDVTTMVRRSVLSGVMEQAQDYTKGLGSTDRQRMDEYFTSIRQLENQLALQLEKPPPNEVCVRPSSPASGEIGTELETAMRNHKLMANLVAMAVACDQTRVFNILYSQALSRIHRRGETFIHHALTHEEPDDPKLGYQAAVAWYNVRSMEVMADFIDAFRNIREGDGTLLDNILIFANTDTNYAKLHAVDGVPVLTIGRAGGRIKTGIQVLGNGDPISRIGLTCQQVMGLPVDTWGAGSMQTNKPISEILV